MADAATLFLEAAEVVVDLLADPAVGRRWDEESVLEGYHVDALAAHLGRAVVTVRDYLDAEPPRGGPKFVDAAGYFSEVLADHDPVASEFHGHVRGRSEEAAAGGQHELVATLREALADLRGRGLDADRSLSVGGSVAIRLSEYLKTRLVELVVHTEDLAESVGIPSPEFRKRVWNTVADVVARTAIKRNGARALAMSLARAERTERLSAF